MSEILVLSSVGTTEAKTKVAKRIFEERFFTTSVFLPLPPELGNMLIEKENFSLENFEAKEESTLEKPFLEPYKPILRTLKHLYLNVQCFMNNQHFHSLKKVLEEIFLLTFRSRVGGIQVDKWRKVISKKVLVDYYCGREEADFVKDHIDGRVICVDLGESGVEKLKNEGFKVKNEVVEESLKPLDLLEWKIKEEIFFGKEINDEEVKKLVSLHLKFIDYVLESRNFDEAYQKWKKDSCKWLT